MTKVCNFISHMSFFLFILSEDVIGGGACSYPHQRTDGAMAGLNMVVGLRPTLLFYCSPVKIMDARAVRTLQHAISQEAAPE